MLLDPLLVHLAKMFEKSIPHLIRLTSMEVSKHRKRHRHMGEML